MSGRPYPDAVAGPFPVPPRTLTDRADRPIDVGILDPDDDRVPDLADMYEHFDPADRAQGIPPGTRGAIEEWLEVVLASGPDVLAQHGDRVVGHATLVNGSAAEYELAIFVDGPYQGQGIGTALVESLLGLAAERGIERVWLTVERWNVPAISVYERVGFQRCEAGSFELEMTIRLA